MRFALGLGIAACLAYLGSEIFVFSRLALPLDDSWIHLQFARQLAEGHGLTYNGGDWVPGSTAPLWTALLALGFVLPFNVLVWAKLLGIGAFLGTVVGSDRVAVELGLRGSLRTVSTASVAACHWLVWSALSGMEICLFVCVSVWGWAWHLRERRSPSGMPQRSALLFAVGSLLRPEGLLLWCLAVVDRGIGWRRDDPSDAAGLTTTFQVDRPLLLIHGGLAALLVLPVALFNYLSSGSPLATTFAVKGGGGGLLPSGDHLRKVLDILFGAQPILVLLVGAGCLVLFKRLGTHRDQGLLPVFWLVGLPLANAVLSPSALGNFGRYYFPLLPWVAVIGSLGLSSLWRTLGAELQVGTWRLRWRPFLVLLLLAPQLWSVLQGVPRYLQTLGNVEDSDVRAARWLAPRLPPQATLAVQDIGALKFWLPNQVIDLAGIVTPEVQSVLSAGRGEGDTYWEKRLYDFLATRRPDYLVVFPNSYPLLTRSVPGFEAVQRFPIEQNVTMAGPELVIFSTPWTRHRLRSIEPPAP